MLMSLLRFTCGGGWPAGVSGAEERARCAVRRRRGSGRRWCVRTKRHRRCARRFARPSLFIAQLRRAWSRGAWRSHGSQTLLLAASASSEGRGRHDRSHRGWPPHLVACSGRCFVAQVRVGHIRRRVIAAHAALLLLSAFAHLGDVATRHSGVRQLPWAVLQPVTGDARRRVRESSVIIRNREWGDEAIIFWSSVHALRVEASRLASRPSRPSTQAPHQCTVQGPPPRREGELLWGAPVVVSDGDDAKFFSGGHHGPDARVRA